MSARLNMLVLIVPFLVAMCRLQRVPVTCVLSLVLARMSASTHNRSSLGTPKRSMCEPELGYIMIHVKKSCRASSSTPCRMKREGCGLVPSPFKIARNTNECCQRRCPSTSKVGRSFPVVKVIVLHLFLGLPLGQYYIVSPTE